MIYRKSVKKEEEKSINSKAVHAKKNNNKKIKIIIIIWKKCIKTVAVSFAGLIILAAKMNIAVAKG